MGKALAFTDQRCPSEVDQIWKYIASNEYLDARDGINVQCVDESGLVKILLLTIHER